MKLFEYFLVYTSEWEQPEMEAQNADEVLGQFWQEYAFALESRGFTVHTDFGELRGTIEVNLELLRRAFDNLYANLVKYAEPSEPIDIRYIRSEDQVALTIRNAISPLRDRRESTNIGLNTCRRILKMHHGSFDTAEADEAFTTEIRLPLIAEYGAGLIERMRAIFQQVLTATFLVSIASFLFMLLAGPHAAKIFIKPDDTALLKMSMAAVRIFSFSYLVGWIDMCFSSFFTALDRPVRSLLVSFFGTLVFPIAFLYILTAIWGLNGVWLMASASAVASGVLTLILAKTMKLEKR